jgi:anti-anti-sigma factor
MCRRKGKALTATESATTRDLSISVTDSAGGALVCVSGRVSVDSSPALRKELLAILGRQGLSTLTIDLAEATYIDCSGIATLVEALRLAHTRKTRLQLRGLHDAPRHLLEVTGLLGLFETNGRTSGSSVAKVP